MLEYWLLEYWLLSGAIPYIIITIYFYLTPLQENQISFQKLLNEMKDYRWWITGAMVTCFGFISLLVFLVVMFFILHYDINFILNKKKRFYEQTPWYEQKCFGGWKKFTLREKNNK